MYVYAVRGCRYILLMRLENPEGAAVAYYVISNRNILFIILGTFHYFLADACSQER